MSVETVNAILMLVGILVIVGCALDASRRGPR